MKLRTVQALLFVLVLSLLAADFTVGCGQGYVHGPVTQKFRTSGDADSYIIAVRDQPYNVPVDFWNVVNVGDEVRFTGARWEIVKTATGGTPKPATP